VYFYILQQENNIIEISSRTLSHFTTLDQRTKASIFDLHLFQQKVNKYYCIPLNKTGQCPQNCLLCRPTLIQIVNEIGWRNTRDPYAALARYLRIESEIKIDISKKVIGSRQFSRHYRIPGGK
jgi:hypothetical protein